MCDEGRHSFPELQHETRLTAPLVQAKDELVAETWGAAIVRAGAAIEDFRRLYGPRSIGAVIDAHSTNEEAFALKQLMTSAIGSDRIATLNWSPPGASGDDDLLILANKNPNTLGLASLSRRRFAIGGGRRTRGQRPQSRCSRRARRRLGVVELSHSTSRAIRRNSEFGPSTAAWTRRPLPDRDKQFGVLRLRRLRSG